ncbi:hypothetical protein ACW9HH_32625 [Nocardia gipuzkoensis]
MKPNITAWGKSRVIDPAHINTRAELQAALARLYTERGMSYQKLAAGSGVQQSAIHAWVRGESFPRWSSLTLVLQVLGVSDTAQMQQWKLAHDRARAEQIARPGVPLSEVTDPFVLEVHQPITVDLRRDLSVLPPYVRRAHDDRLSEIVAAAAGGVSAMAVLLGGSSTGKTRALWEALALLRERGGWRVWRPWYPTRHEELREGLARVGPRTVVWLNETQRYFDGMSATERERTATALQSLLADGRRAPVLIVGSVWPEHYTVLCRDPGSATRKLLSELAALIRVPLAFTGADLDAMRRASQKDPRLAQACEGAAGGQITQYLAGGPELVERYENQVSAAARVVIEVAMDAVRLGHRNLLSSALLRDAAVAAMDDDLWDRLGENWFEAALTEAGQECKGARGPLTAVRTRTGPARSGGSAAPVSGRAERPEPDTPMYQLADYLDQYGRRARAEVVPPFGFWAAVADHAGPDGQHMLARAAWARGLRRLAAQLWKSAAGHGHTRAAADLVTHLNEVFPGDRRAAGWVTARVAVDDPDAVATLLQSLWGAGAVRWRNKVARRAAARTAVDDPFAVRRLLLELDQPRVLASRAAAQTLVDDAAGVATLLDELNQSGMRRQARVLASRVAAQTLVDDAARMAELLEQSYWSGMPLQLRVSAACAEALALLGETAAVSWLNKRLDRPRTSRAFELLAERAAAHCPVDNVYGVTRLLKILRMAGAGAQFELLAARAAASIVLDDSYAVENLLEELRAADAVEELQELASRAAAHTPLDSSGMGGLLRALNQPGTTEQFAMLAARAGTDDPSEAAVAVVERQDTHTATHSVVDDPVAAAELLQRMRFFRSTGPYAVLAERAAAHTCVDDPHAVARLLYELREAPTTGPFEVLASRAAAHTALDSPETVAWLLERFRFAGADEQVQTLLARDPAAHTAFDNPGWLARLLKELRAAGAEEQVQTLLARDLAAHTVLGFEAPADALLLTLRWLHADDQFDTLRDRLSANGLFHLFLRWVPDPTERFHLELGREPDGRPAQPWDWGDL